MSKWVMLITVLVVLSVSSRALTAYTASLVAKVSMSAIVKIERTWRQQSGGTAYQVTASSMGTVVGRNMILTHNHFGTPFGMPEDTFMVTDLAGRSTSWPAADVQLIVVGTGTSLLRLPSNVSLASAPVANQATLQHLSAGDWLAVNYRDGTTKQLVQNDFQIMGIQNGIAQLADPNKLINSGDSGGGVFFNGQLAGNTWSIDTNQDGQALGMLNVALSPSHLSDYVK